jgi:hypothetical protein
MRRHQALLELGTLYEYVECRVFVEKLTRPLALVELGIPVEEVAD